MLDALPDALSDASQATMRCLSCWKDIRDKAGIYTKSCKHTFCTLNHRSPVTIKKSQIIKEQKLTFLFFSCFAGKGCSEKAFKKDLACPLCDTVLAKDGFGEMVVNPDDNDMRKAGASIFGFEPDDMCQVLQIGLDFWTKQKHNEIVKHSKDMKMVHDKLEEADAQNAKLLKVRHLGQQRYSETALSRISELTD